MKSPVKKKNIQENSGANVETAWNQPANRAANVLFCCLLATLAACGGGNGTDAVGSGQDQVVTDSTGDTGNVGGDTSGGDGSQSGGSGDANDGQPTSGQTDQARMFMVDLATGLGAASGSGADATDAGVATDSTDQRQLLPAVEAAIANVSIQADGNESVVSFDITNQLPGTAWHAMTVVADVQWADGSSTSLEYPVAASDLVSDSNPYPFVLGDETQQLALRLPQNQSIQSLNLAVFADTADHYVYAPEATATTFRVKALPPATHTARSLEDLRRYIGNAPADSVITMLVPTSGWELTIDTTLEINRRITIIDDIGNPVDLKAGAALSGPIVRVIRDGDLIMYGLRFVDARESALFVRDGGRAELHGTRFLDNQGQSGAAVRNRGILALHTYAAFGAVDFTSNSASDRGGAIRNFSSGSLHIDGGTRFSGNSALNAGGAILNEGQIYTHRSYLGEIKFETNNASSGGAIANATGATVNASAMNFQANRTFPQNQSDTGSGGAVSNTGSFTLTGGEFASNAARYGGAINNGGEMSVSGATFTGNTASQGAGVNTCGTTFVMRASLLYQNTFPSTEEYYTGNGINVTQACTGPSSYGGSPAAGGASGVTVKNQSGYQLDLEHVTIWRNDAVEGQYGSGIYLDNGASAIVRNSIVASNKGGDLFMSDVDAADPENVSYVSQNNMYSVMDKLPLGAGDIASTDPFNPMDPQLSLSSDGWPVPAANSPVVNAGNCVGQGNYESQFDIRDLPRVDGSNCDMGAVELTSEEQQGSANSGAQSVIITDLRPDHSYQGSDWVELSLGNSLLWVDGQVATQGLVSVRYSLNYDQFFEGDISAILAAGGNFSQSFGNFYNYTARTLRSVTDGLNNLRVEARYDNGNTVIASEDFYARFNCDDVEPYRHCSYTSGAAPSTVTASGISNFQWWDVTSTSVTSFDLTLDYASIGNIRVGCDASDHMPDCEFQAFAYRINGGQPVMLSPTEIAAAKQTDKGYKITIPVSGLVSGRNGIVFGSLYGDTWMATHVVHVNVQ